MYVFNKVINRSYSIIQTYVTSHIYFLISNAPIMFSKWRVQHINVEHRHCESTRNILEYISQYLMQYCDIFKFFANYTVY